MNELMLQIFLAITGLVLSALPAGIWCIALELRAIRKVLQARWDYDRYRRWLELKEDSQVRYLRFAPALLQRPYKLLDMSGEPHGLNDSSGGCPSAKYTLTPGGSL